LEKNPMETTLERPALVAAETTSKAKTMVFWRRLQATQASA
jgi:hypothetical protein